jgi:hypothetical protein
MDPPRRKKEREDKATAKDDLLTIFFRERLGTYIYS